MIGLGTLLFGFLPRLAVYAMYAALTGSFVLTLVDSVYKLDDNFMKLSLFHYTNFNLNQWPDWGTFGWFMLVSTCLAAIGIWRFTRRDIIPE
jgi:putative exporter of polyketide antibiotics